MGVLPPIRPGAKGNSPDRSPYIVDLSVFISHFCISQERKKILDGLIRFRHELHNMGMTSGFQWLNGSFSENVELIEKRGPNDIDVVTFYYLPSGEDQSTLISKAPDLFHSKHIKDKYFVDGYYIMLGDELDEVSVRLVNYWYSMWSHKRDNFWKGFVQVSLDPSADLAAAAILNA